MILELDITGSNECLWHGLPPTGKTVRFPLCAIYSFDREHNLTGERIYYDRASILRQLGMFHEPLTIPGRLLAPALPPITILKILIRTAYQTLLYGLRTQFDRYHMTWMSSIAKDNGVWSTDIAGRVVKNIC